MARTKSTTPIRREASNGWIDHRLSSEQDATKSSKANGAAISNKPISPDPRPPVAPPTHSIPEQLAQTQDAAGISQLIICIGGIYTAFITWGILQERITTTPYVSPGQTEGEIFSYTIFVNTIQAVFASMVGYAYLMFTSRDKSKTPAVFPTQGIVGPLFLVGLTQALASPFGYASLKHTGYITYILAKSCKLVPVMFLRVILYRTRYPLYKYAVVALVTTGVATFALYNPSTQKKASKGSNREDQNLTWGLFLLGVNLLFDGLTNSTQDYINAAHKPYSGPQMMCAVNSVGVLFYSSYLLSAPYLIHVLPSSVLPPAAASELVDAISFIQRHPAVLKDVLLFAICGGLGQVFIFYTLNKFSSLLLTTVTVTRKMLTMLFSVLLYGHKLTSGQWAGVGLVFGGVAAEAAVGRWEKQRKEKVLKGSYQESKKER